MAISRRGELRFLLGEQERRLRDVAPDLTVLDYLRRVERRSGTKEGCGEGDCGACSVVIGEPANGAMRYLAVNACIQFLATLDGKQILSVEDLRGSDGKPHPCQQAIVETHGSQCGFCTPGFVMSLFSLFHEGGHVDRNRIDDALAGNLCRCTGYGPIVAAANRMREIANKDRFDDAAKETAERLMAMDDGASLEMTGPAGRFLAPRSIEELALALEEYPNATVVAGGTDVGLWSTKLLRRLDHIIYLGRIEELRRMEQRNGVLSIGAGVTYSQAMPMIANLSPDFGELFRRLGSTQIRNVGTIGGNIANGSPIGDSAPALIALGARLVLRHGAAERTIALEDFFIEYGRQDRTAGEFVVRIEVPAPQPGDVFRCYKISKRFDQDITACLGAYWMNLENGSVKGLRIAYGGMAGIPKRARLTEAAMVEREWNEATIAAGIEALAGEFEPIDDMRASADYRARVAANLLRKFFIETIEPQSHTQIAKIRRTANVGG